MKTFELPESIAPTSGEKKGMSRPDVPRYYRVSTRFWTDEKASKWPESTQKLALYLLSCPHRSLEGIFVCPLPYIEADLGWTRKKVIKNLERLVADEFVSYDHSAKLMLIHNALRYQKPENDNTIKGALRRIRDLPDSPLLVKFLQLAKKHCYKKGGDLKEQQFYLQLEQQVQQQSALLTSSLNLQSSTEPKPKPLTESPLSGERNGDFLSGKRGDDEEGRLTLLSANECLKRRRREQGLER